MEIMIVLILTMPAKLPLSDTNKLHFLPPNRGNIRLIVNAVRPPPEQDKAVLTAIKAATGPPPLKVTRN